ncbi:MAG: ACT domain-containing protein [Verrucomicrobiales bacterium]|nr:ACT domain-containing protein [Verrucomicrobiales bacterium]
MNAPISLIINIAGPDRPGLVQSLSTTISNANGNWEGSRMARFEGHFAGVVHAVVSPENLDSLKKSLIALASDELLVSVVEGGSGKAETTQGVEVFSLEVVGQDRTGIVSEISRVLASMGVNVEELATECSSAPMSGERLFEAHAVIEIPANHSGETVQQEIEKIAQDLAVTISEFDD